MHTILLATAFMGMLPTEDDLLNQKNEETYHYVRKDNRQVIALTFMQIKGIFAPRQEIFLQASTSLKPWKNKLFTHAWKGSYTLKKTQKGLQIECRLIRKFETGISGDLIPTPQSRFKPVTVILHVDQFSPGRIRPKLQIHFTAEKLKKLNFWKANEKINLY